MTATVAALAARVVRRLGLAAVDAAERPAITETVPVDALAARALQWIGAVAADEAPQPADLTLARDKLRALNEAQVAAGNASWPADAIPLAVAEEMVMLAAMHLGPAFGKAADPQGLPAIEARIRRAAAVARAQAAAEQAVLDVHAWLDASGRARWTVWDIPDFAEGPYVVLAANLLAPQYGPAFGAMVDELGEARALRQLAQVVALPTSGEAMRPEYF